MKGYDFDFMPLYLDEWEQSNVIGSMPASSEGLFLRLILKQWRNECLPTDEERCKSLSRAKDAEWKAFKPYFDEVFPVGDDGQRRNPKCDERRKTAISKIDRLRANGNLGGRPPKKTNEKPNGSELDNQEETKRKRSAKPDGSLSNKSKELPKGNSPQTPKGAETEFASFNEFLEKFKEVYPARTGGQNWPKATEKLKTLWQSQGAAIISGAIAYSKMLEGTGKIGSEFVKQASTWVTQRCWGDDYESGLPPSSPAKNKPVAGVDYELKVIGDEFIKVIPGTDTPFDSTGQVAA